MNTEAMIIRQAHHADIDAMYAITSHVHLSDFYRSLIPPQTWERYSRYYVPNEPNENHYRRKITSRLNNPLWHVWVAELKGQVCGFSMAVETNEIVEIRGLVVDTRYQGSGIGRALFAAVCKVAQPGMPLSLEVISTNMKAIQMYERAGFKAVQASTNSFYGAPMIRMIKH